VRNAMLLVDRGIHISQAGNDWPEKRPFLKKVWGGGGASGGRGIIVGRSPVLLASPKVRNESPSRGPEKKREDDEKRKKSGWGTEKPWK